MGNNANKGAIMLSDKEINDTYKIICDKYERNLKKFGVSLPRLKDNKGNYTKNALVLVALAKGYPDTEALSKQQLTDFMKEYFDDINDVQQARHLAMQDGWYIESGQRGDNAQLKKGSYKLKTLDSPYPSFLQERRAGFSGDFDSLKRLYDNRCATCGAKEGEKHHLRKTVSVVLQKGHMDPTKPLVEGNIIPQCQICNRADRNRWIFDKTGRVIEVAPTEDGKRIVMTFLRKANVSIRKSVLEALKKLVP